MFGVIADDITGSNDIGVMFSKSGYIVDIYSYRSNVLSDIPFENRDVLIFDTDSRLDDQEEAYQKVYHATKEIQRAGASQFYNKTCSVFRGNIGVEFDAMLDALEEEFAVVVLGFPKNGRTTIDSIHYVYGEKLEDSPFNKDPIHPMNESNLVDILQKQTKRKVGAIHHGIIKQGSDVIKRELEKLKKSYQFNYVILDVTAQSDLYEIAKAVHEQKVICGSSALAEEIPKVRGNNELKQNTLPFPKMVKEKGLFCAAGSLMPQTCAQINYMKNTDSQVIELDTLSLMNKENPSEMIEQLQTEIISKINKGKNVVLHSSNTEAKVSATKKIGMERGWSNTKISRFISETIANITVTVIKQTGQFQFVIAGGDTSATLCKNLGIDGMRVWKEIQPGLPSCLSHTDPPYLFVLKSGSFGDESFIEKAFEHLLQAHLSIK